MTEKLFEPDLGNKFFRGALKVYPSNTPKFRKIVTLRAFCSHYDKINSKSCNFKKEVYAMSKPILVLLLTIFTLIAAFSFTASATVHKDYAVEAAKNDLKSQNAFSSTCTQENGAVKFTTENWDGLTFTCWTDSPNFQPKEFPADAYLNMSFKYTGAGTARIKLVFNEGEVLLEDFLKDNFSTIDINSNNQYVFNQGEYKFSIKLSDLGLADKDTYTATGWVLNYTLGTVEFKTFEIADTPLSDTPSEDDKPSEDTKPVEQPDNVPAGADSHVLEIPDGKMAVYSVDIDFKKGDDIKLKLYKSEIFSLNGSTMKINGNAINANYGSGKYNIKTVINPTQEITYIEVTLPDGGSLRRGTYAVLKAYKNGVALNLYLSDEAAFSNAKFEYVNITNEDYELNKDEPEYTGFKSNVFNLVTSFDNAKTTRNFAWTALANYIGNNDMSVRYRIAGTDAWSMVDAVRQAEPNNIASEDYFKANITELIPGTKYEYQIGKKDSTKADDWSEVYSFTTEANECKEFSFVAVGDTQSITWGGTTAADKGMMFAQAAIKKAFEKLPNAAFMLHVGDMVDDGGNRNMWNHYFKALGDYCATIPHFAVPGNHDVWQVKSFFFNQHFNHPSNGGNSAIDLDILNTVNNNISKALINNCDEMVYSYDYGDVHFVVLLSGNYLEDDAIIMNSQREWLEKDLETNKDAKWTIVSFHEPAYSQEGVATSRREFSDIIEKYGVDLVIQGHAHFVTRTYPMKDGKIVTKLNPNIIQQGTGTVYTTIGSTTLTHTDASNPNAEELYTIFTPASQVPTYTTVDVSDEKITLTIRQINGFVIDTFSIIANKTDTDESEPIVSTSTENLINESVLNESIPNESEVAPPTTHATGKSILVFAIIATIIAIVSFVGGYAVAKAKR